MPPEPRRRACRKMLHVLFSHDDEIRRKYPVVAGLDEAGRGPLAGPVVAAAVVLPPGLTIEGLRDSKKIAEKERKEVFWHIVRCAVAVGVGIVTAEEIDRTNILRSTKRAMEIALEDLGIRPDILLIDAVQLPHIDIPQHSIIRGESASASIAAASVVAKVVRDDIMLDYHEKYPAYNFKAHKGYSTRQHMEMLRAYGPCPIHRKSFSRVMDVQPSLDYGLKD
ncbi:MAG: ribonuclease HII [Deferribacteres bacterium]|nr:ribonuclease HII [Deferribacteres bacterium]